METWTRHDVERGGEEHDVASHVIEGSSRR
jgi:hypothetical protein